MFHGGSRQGLDLCIMCHQPQNSDPDTGNSLDMKVLTHKIHMGSQLPSVQAGTPYQIVGYQNSVSDWSTEVYPGQSAALHHVPSADYRRGAGHRLARPSPAALRAAPATIT